MTLTKTETDLLVGSAGRPNAVIVLPTRMKPASLQRLVARTGTCSTRSRLWRYSRRPSTT